MNPRILVHPLAIAAILASIVNCSTEPATKSSRYGNSTSTRRVAADPKALDATPAKQCENDICEIPIDDSPVIGPVAKAQSSWCTSAAATKTGGEELGELLATICKDGSPTQFMLNNLVPNAFKGSGEPQLFAVKPIETANRLVSAFFAVAIKMPISADDHFNRIAPADGTIDTEKGKIQSQGGTPGNDIKVTPVTTKDDRDWIRGWVIDSNSTMKTTGFPAATIKIRYSYQMDHFKFEDAGYLYSAVMKNSVETVRGYQILNAVLDIDGSGYQIVIAKIAADDKGQAAKVRDAVKSLATNLVKFLYQQSTK